MNIVVGYKESKMSKSILDLVRQHAKAFDATVYLVSSLEGGVGEKIEDLRPFEPEQFVEALFQ